MTGHARYTIRRKIADGGTAEIFLATQHGAHGFEKPVVLKRIFPAFSADPLFRNMLIDEAHIAMSLNHSNIVQVLDLGEVDSQYVLALELVDGWNLDSVLRRANKANLPIPPALALYITAEVCRALAYAHAKTGPGGKPLGIVHRDISPHNVLLSEQGEVKLTDFGIATAESLRDQSGGAMIKGKIAYMSPEQAAGAILDARSDLYSVGIMLYVMICRRFPYDAATDYETLLLVRSGEFVPPQTARPGLNPEIYRVISRAMAKRTSDRYQRAEDMLVDVEQVMRVAFRAVGQTELKRWLVELSTRDGVPPLSRQTSSAAGTPPSGAEGETFELKGIPAGGRERAPARPAGTGKRPPPPAAALFVGRGGLPPAKDPTEEITLTPLPLTPAPQMAEAVLAAASAGDTAPVVAARTSAPAPPPGLKSGLAWRELARNAGAGVLTRLRDRSRRGQVVRTAVAAVALVLVMVAIGALSSDDHPSESGSSAPKRGSHPDPRPATTATKTAPSPGTPTAAPSEPESTSDTAAAPGAGVAAAPPGEPPSGANDAGNDESGRPREHGLRDTAAIPAAGTKEAPAGAPAAAAPPAEAAPRAAAAPPAQPSSTPGPAGAAPAPAPTPTPTAAPTTTPTPPPPSAAKAPAKAAAEDPASASDQKPSLRPTAAPPPPVPTTSAAAAGGDPSRSTNGTTNLGSPTDPPTDPAEPNLRVPVRLESDPAGAHVSAGTISLGKTPLELKLRGGSVYVVTLSSEGLPPVTKRIYVTGRPNQRVMIDLKKSVGQQQAGAQPRGEGSAPAPKPGELRKGDARAKDARTTETAWPKFAR